MMKQFGKILDELLTNEKHIKRLLAPESSHTTKYETFVANMRGLNGTKHAKSASR